jgi:hypothetical protein
MKILLNEESVRISDSKLSDAIFAQIYIEIDASTNFPEIGWDDFAEIVLDWWTDSAIKLINEKSEASFRFMDGDFCMTAEILNDGVADFKFYEKNKLTHEAIGDAYFFAKSILVASRALSRAIFNISNGKRNNSLFLKKQNTLRDALKRVSA